MGIVTHATFGDHWPWHYLHAHTLAFCKIFISLLPSASTSIPAIIQRTYGGRKRHEKWWLTKNPSCWINVCWSTLIHSLITLLPLLGKSNRLGYRSMKCTTNLKKVVMKLRRYVSLKPAMAHSSHKEAALPYGKKEGDHSFGRHRIEWKRDYS